MKSLRFFVAVVCIAILFQTHVPTAAVAQSAATTSKPPFRMLVLGDSVIWGQGLRPENKFSTLVRNDIEALLGRDVEVVNHSHSGATITSQYDDALTQPGEVPLPSPTLWQQLRTAVSQYKCAKRAVDEGKVLRMRSVCKDVDLVLLDGGINDMGVDVLLNPFTTEGRIKRDSRSYCFRRMKEFLDEVMATFENATIVVTGYFPVICSGEGGTDPTAIGDVIRSFLGWDKGSQNDAKRAKTKLGVWLTTRIAKRSKVWKERSDIDLSESVAEANRTAKTSRAIFVKIAFEPNECYAGTNTKLWQLKGFDPDGNPITDDEMLGQRLEICHQAAKEIDDIYMNIFLKLFLKAQCKPAASGHPNVAGAKKYHEAVWTALRPVLASRQE